MVHDASKVTTILFTDIEGSTRLWEQEPERMRPALARHDALAKTAVEGNRGTVMKTTGDGLYASFDDSLDAVVAALELQLALSDPATTHDVALRLRCGLHTGEVEQRDNDLFGSAINRAARIMAAAHGGQTILSQVVAEDVRDRLPTSVTLRDLGSVRLRDLGRPERIYQVVHPQLRQDFPALRSLESTPNNLPQEITPFIGREHALAEVRQLLSNARLLTLVGMGGLGKTRLSLRLSAEVLDEYADGVWFVELAPLEDARLVAQAVASVLGVKEEPGRPVLEALLDFVKDRLLLLILDNCEHLVHACAQLAKDLLQSGSLMKVLASSREPLHVMGETTYPVSTLAVPDPKQALSVAALTQNEAVDFFRDRALAALPAFRITEQNAMAVVEICRHLDGIPLALELAAARVRALAVGQIAARLSDRFRLLTRGDTTALPRQQTLRACIDWSYDLLTDRERTLLRRLSVFAGGWTLEAAGAVCAGGEIGEADVVDLLLPLVEKSLVTLEAERERYRLLETVRQYTQERMNESADKEDVQSRHLAYFVALAEEAVPELIGPRPGEWLARLDAEQQNILAAHARPPRDERDAELALRLALAAFHIWMHRGPLAIGYRMTVESLNRAEAQKRTLARCRAVGAASQFAVMLGLFREAQAYGEESLAIAREIGNMERVGIAHQLLGMAFTEQGDRATALGHFEESLALTRETGPKRRLAAALQNLARWHREGGNLDAAEPLLVQSLALAREQGDRGANTVVALCELAGLSIERGLHEPARAMLFEATDIASEIGSNFAGRLVLDCAAELAALFGNRERAARFIGAAATQVEQTGIHRDMPLIGKVREALGAAAFAGAEAGGRALSLEEAMAEARAWLEDAS
jgi:predicted ATPase/class 3 adenylate cyclase